MSHLIPGPTCRYQMDEEETLRGSILMTEQKQFLQNQKADIADQLLALKMDPQNPIAFGLEQAHLQGQLDFCTYLFNCSETSENQMRELLASRSQSGE